LSGAEKISGRQGVFLLVMAVLPTSILFLPHMIYKGARQDSWLSVLFLTFFGLAAGEVIARLGRRFPGQTVVEYGRTLLGPLPGFALGLLYAGFFIYINAFVVRELAEMMTANFYEETPVAVFVAGIVLFVVYVVRCGLEVLARVNDMILPLVLGMLALLGLVVIPAVRPEHFFPVLEEGFLPAVKGALPGGVFFAESFVMLMLTPSLARPAEVRAVVAKGVLFLGLLQLLVVVAVTGVLGENAAHLLYPVLNVARLIRPSRFLTNVDPLVLLPWLMGGLLKVAIFHYCATLAAARLFRAGGFGAAAVVCGAVLGVLAVILWENVLELADQIARVVPPFFLSIQVGIPLLLLLAAVVKRKGGAG
jgi:spore germination protein KB